GQVLQSISQRWTMNIRPRSAISLLTLGLVMMLGWLGCSPAPDPWGGAPSPRVVVTFAPLYSFVKGVGGDHVAVRCLCTTAGPHHYEESAQDHQLVRDADLLFALGLTLDEKFADALAKDSRSKGFQYVKLGERLPRALLLPMGHHDEHEKGK